QIIGGANMTTAVRVSEDLVKQAKIIAKLTKDQLRVKLNIGL
ncbi:conserved hypothetical protein, partial [delta proteobacterium NaphS2]